MGNFLQTPMEFPAVHQITVIRRLFFRQIKNMFIEHFIDAGTPEFTGTNGRILNIPERYPSVSDTGIPSAKLKYAFFRYADECYTGI